MKRGDLSGDNLPKWWVVTFFFEMIMLQANVTVCVITDRYTVTIIHFYSTVAQVLRYDMCNRLRFLQILKITFFT